MKLADVRVGLPRLSHAQALLTHQISAVNEFGDAVRVAIPAERALTVYVDRREVLTLMTLGAHPEWLVLGFLLNQRIIADASELESITVDWEVAAAAVKTRRGIDALEEKTASRVVTTGCGQGSVFGGVMKDLDRLLLAPTTLSQQDLYSMVTTMRLHQSIYKVSGSVHGCALFRGPELVFSVEDVGRHNALDTIAGWMAMHGPIDRTGLSFYTTGRLTSEMVIKAAQMGVAVVVSRSGITQMGLAVAARLGLCAIGRANGRHFLCYSAAERLLLQNGSAGARLRVVA
jgi:FdhD protein